MMNIYIYEGDEVKKRTLPTKKEQTWHAWTYIVWNILEIGIDVKKSHKSFWCIDCNTFVPWQF